MSFEVNLTITETLNSENDGTHTDSHTRAFSLGGGGCSSVNNNDMILFYFPPSHRSVTQLSRLHFLSTSSHDEEEHTLRLIMLVSL